MKRLLLVSAILLAGCAPRIMAANQDSITLTFDSAYALDTALEQGMAHCARQGKKGTPTSGYRVGLRYVQVVECR